MVCLLHHFPKPVLLPSLSTSCPIYPSIVSASIYISLSFPVVHFQAYVFPEPSLSTYLPIDLRFQSIYLYLYISTARFLLSPPRPVSFPCRPLSPPQRPQFLAGLGFVKVSGGVTEAWPRVSGNIIFDLRISGFLRSGLRGRTLKGWR